MASRRHRQRASGRGPSDVGKPAAASDTAQALLANTDGQALDIADQLSSTLELLVEDTTSIHCEISADDPAVGAA